MFQFTYQLDDKGYIALANDLLIYGKSRKRRRALLRFLLILLMLLSLDMSLIIRPNIISLAVITVIFVALLTILFKPLMKLMLRMNIPGFKRLGGVPYSQSNALAFEENEIICKHGLSEFKAQYAAVRIIDIGKIAVFLHLDALRAIIIPLSCFADDNERKWFFEFIKEKVNFRENKSNSAKKYVIISILVVFIIGFLIYMRNVDDDSIHYMNIPNITKNTFEESDFTGTLQIGDIISFRIYKWKVLDMKDHKALLISEDIHVRSFKDVKP